MQYVPQRTLEEIILQKHILSVYASNHACPQEKKTPPAPSVYSASDSDAPQSLQVGGLLPYPGSKNQIIESHKAP